MKLAKTLLACIVALVLVASCVSAMASEVATVNAIADKSNVSIGDEITVTVQLTDAVDFKAGAAWLTFDNTLVELVSTDYGESRASIAIAEDASEIATANARGSINNSIAYTKSETKDTISIYTATFKAKANGEAKFGFSSNADELMNVNVGKTASVTIADATTTTTTEPVVTTTEPVVVTTTEAPKPVTTTAAPKTPESTTKPASTPKTGDASMAIVAGLAVLAGAAFVASKKSK